MSYSYSGSSDSKYFFVYDDKKLSFMSGENCLWQVENDKGAVTFCEVSNLGSVLIENSQHEVFFVKPGSSGIMESLPLPPSEQLHPSSVGKYAHMSEDGRFVFFMKKTAKAANKFFASLSKDENQPREFEFVRIELQTLNTKSLYKTSLPSALEPNFLWNISRDAYYYLVTTPKKSGSKINVEVLLIDSSSSKAVKTMRLIDTDIRETAVHRSGIVLLKLVQGNSESFAIMTRDGNIFHLNYEPGKKFFYLAKSFVLFENRETARGFICTAQSFSGHHLATYNMNTFVEKGVDFDLLFNARDMLSLVYMYNDKFYAFSTELLTLTTEIKRFEIIASKGADKTLGSNDGFDYYRDYFGYPSENEDADSLKNKEIEKLEMLDVSRDVKRSPEPQTSQVSDLPEPRPVPKPKTISIDFEITSSKVQPGIEDEIDPGLGSEEVEPDIINADEDFSKKTKKLSPEEAELRIMQEYDSPSVDSVKDEPVKKPLDLDVSAGERHKTEASPPLNIKTSLPSPEVPVNAEIRKLERLLESIEERFMLGEINEESYRDLKAKYQRQLQAKRK